MIDIGEVFGAVLFTALVALAANWRARRRASRVLKLMSEASFDRHEDQAPEDVTARQFRTNFEQTMVRLGMGLKGRDNSGDAARFSRQAITIDVRYAPYPHVWLRYRSGHYYPISFWAAVLNGERTFPDAYCGYEELGRLVDNLDSILEMSKDERRQVVRMGREYGASLQSLLRAAN